jgi:threonine dehydrogenase-like Zn-dependent dehydrogenase
MLGLNGLPAGEDPLKAATALTDGEGFDVVFDATGNRQAMETSFGFVAHGGRYVLVSVVKEAITFADPDFHRKEMTLFGSRNATAADFRRVLAAIGEGRVPVAAIITHRTSLADAVRNIPLWATEKTGLIKALVEIDS